MHLLYFCENHNNTCNISSLQIRAADYFGNIAKISHGGAMSKYSQQNAALNNDLLSLRATETIFNSPFPPLQMESRTHVDTACAAYHLGRKAQTMRVWASAETGPIRPIRINGRLAWSVADLQRILELNRG